MALQVLLILPLKSSERVGNKPHQIRSRLAVHLLWTNPREYRTLVYYIHKLGVFVTELITLKIKLSMKVGVA